MQIFQVFGAITWKETAMINKWYIEISKVKFIVPLAYQREIAPISILHLPLYLNVLPQMLHTKGFSPVCFL